MFENLVYLKIKSKKPCYIYKNKTEIDFVFINQNNVYLYEVKSGMYNKTPKALHEFEKKYDKTFNTIKKFVINKQYFSLKNSTQFIPVYLC